MIICAMKNAGKMAIAIMMRIAITANASPARRVITWALMAIAIKKELRNMSAQTAITRQQTDIAILKAARILSTNARKVMFMESMACATPNLHAILAMSWEMTACATLSAGLAIIAQAVHSVAAGIA